MTDINLLDNPHVKRTLTQSDEKYWYPYGFKIEHHTVTCSGCGRVETSTRLYKIFAHYLYTPHTNVYRAVPYAFGLTPFLPRHKVEIHSTQEGCAECLSAESTFPDDIAWRLNLKTEAAARSAEARRSNQLRDIFGGPPRRTAAPEGPKVTLADFLSKLQAAK